MLKKSLTFGFTLLLLFAILCPAFADVVWEPTDDFYSAHRDECTTVDDKYHALSTLKVYKSPEDDTVVETIEEGADFYTCVVWKNNWRLLSDESGWIIPQNCQHYYNIGNFYEDHAGEFTDAPADEIVSMEEGLVLWTFPGSDHHFALLSGNVELAEQMGEKDIKIDKHWTDSKGRVWGRTGWLYQLGDENWICLNDRYNENLPITAPEFSGTIPGETATPAETTEPATQTTEKETTRSRILLPIVLVVCVMLVTGVIIVLLSLKNKRKKNAAPITAPGTADYPQYTEDSYSEESIGWHDPQ
ncbi:MAG: hypothetical protein IJJ85_00415 [Clostridia bacterium]|nr:hypothetical protein [Clostridia bacterium]